MRPCMHAPMRFLSRGHVAIRACSHTCMRACSNARMYPLLVRTQGFGTTAAGAGAFLSGTMPGRLLALAGGALLAITVGVTARRLHEKRNTAEAKRRRQVRLRRRGCGHGGFDASNSVVHWT
eukprot:354941-Chlamydomonas_euryale.AAC.7